MRRYVIVFMALFCAVEAAYGAMGAVVFDTTLRSDAIQTSTTASTQNHQLTSLITSDFSTQNNHTNSASMSWEPLEQYLTNVFSMPVIAEQENSSPEPATMLLFGSGMAGLIFITRRKFKKE